MIALRTQTIFGYIKWWMLRTAETLSSFLMQTKWAGLKSIRKRTGEFVLLEQDICFSVTIYSVRAPEHSWATRLSSAKWKWHLEVTLFRSSNVFSIRIARHLSIPTFSSATAELQTLNRLRSYVHFREWEPDLSTVKHGPSKQQAESAFSPAMAARNYSR